MKFKRNYKKTNENISRLYKYLYNNDNDLKGFEIGDYYTAVEVGDSLLKLFGKNSYIKDGKEYLEKLIKNRGDIFTSDREVAAFACKMVYNFEISAKLIDSNYNKLVKEIFEKALNKVRKYEKNNDMIKEGFAWMKIAEYRTVILYLYNICLSNKDIEDKDVEAFAILIRVLYDMKMI